MITRGSQGARGVITLSMSHPSFFPLAITSRSPGDHPAIPSRPRALAPSRTRPRAPARSSLQQQGDQRSASRAIERPANHPGESPRRITPANHPSNRPSNHSHEGQQRARAALAGVSAASPPNFFSWSKPNEIRVFSRSRHFFCGLGEKNACHIQQGSLGIGHRNRRGHPPARP